MAGLKLFLLNISVLFSFLGKYSRVNQVLVNTLYEEVNMVQ
jgi:hypothetical protein